MYNPLEEGHVKFIANYIDIAVEAASAVSSGAEGTRVAPVCVTAGVSWQPNKNVLTKLHCSTEHGVAGTLAVRNWWDPSVAVAATVGVSPQGTSFVGARLQLSNYQGDTTFMRGRNVDGLAADKWATVRDTGRFDESRKH